MSNEIVEYKKLNQVELFELEKQKFQFMLEKARFFSNSDMVPKQYRTFTLKKVKVTLPNGRWEMQEQAIENPAAIGNCLIAMDLAQRIGMSDIMVMQAIDVIEGKSRWSGKGAIAAINSCGRFTPLEWTEEDLGEKTIEYTEYDYDSDGKRQAFKKKITIRDRKFMAFATDIKSGKLLKSIDVTLEIAVREGWWTKPGSKWPTMTQLMGQRRAASWFADSHCPDVLMGMRTVEEEQDIRVVDLVQGDDGVFQADECGSDPTKSEAPTVDKVADLKDFVQGKKRGRQGKNATETNESVEAVITVSTPDAEYAEVAEESQRESAETEYDIPYEFK